jgi:dimethylamine/trimethylamine dehydrogenase
VSPARRPGHDILFEPLEIGSKVFRNRFYSVPHALFRTGRRMSEIAFRRMKAEGGWAAVCGGITSLGPDNWGGSAPRIWEETDRAVLARMVAEVHGQGALAGVELSHSGALSEGEKFTPAMGVSQVALPDHAHVVPHALDVDEIHRIQDAWVDGAIAAADIGFDIVYAYGAHGYLPTQFLSPFFNTRTDEYGGSIENRSRFWLEVLERLQAAVGDRCVVAARITSEPFSSYGVPLEDSLRFVRLADDLVDLWDVNVGFHWPPDSAPSRLRPEAYQLEWSGRIREATVKPIVGVGRITNPDRMAEILRSGVWDFIGGARPGIADPFLPRKIEEGRYDEIRECIGANFCIAFETRSTGLSCVQNATIGEEYRRGWHPERFEPARDPAYDVLVVGAGPAGMECARVLGERGFRRVHLVDSAADVGGHLAWLTRLPGLGEWGRVADYRRIQLKRLANVELVLRTRLGADDVLDYGADFVVLATGARWIDAAAGWHHLPLAEIAGAFDVVTPEQLMVEGRTPVDGRVVVWDGDGGAVAVGLAEKLAAEGRDVTLVTPFATVAPFLDLSFEGGGARRRLHDLGVAFVPGVSPTRVDGGALVVADEFGDERSVAAESVVLVAQRVSEEALHRELRARAAELEDAGIRAVHRVGDCNAPRALGHVVADGHRLGRELEADRSALPRAPRAERDGDSAVARFEFPLGAA